MAGLTKAPLSMVDAGENARANDEVKFNGEELESQSPNDSDTQEKYLQQGNFDSDSGTLTLRLNDTSTIVVSGFLTPQSIGIGPKGSTGPKGTNGVPGRNGKDGRDGGPGCPGPKGDIGPKGPPGPVGPTGPAGPAGSPGNQGLQGSPGPAGVNGRDGEAPIYNPGSLVSSEKVSTGRVMQWGRFLDKSEGQVKKIIFPEALNTTNAKSLIIQWVDPLSNVANKVKVESINRGNAVLAVQSALLDTEPDGQGNSQPVSMTGWDFYWFLLGE